MTPEIQAENWKRAGLRWRRNWTAWLGLILILPVFLAASLAPWITPYKPDERDRSQAAPSGPSSSHWLGIDADQKDVFTRVLFGSRLTLVAAAVSIGLAIVIGVPIGVAAGYFGRCVDALLMRFVDIGLAFPSVLIALIAATAFRPGSVAIVLAVGCVNAPIFARHIRSLVMIVKHLAFVEASRALGASPVHILTQAILPATLSPILVLGTLGLGSAILEVAGLSFIGIGGDPTVPEWGSMLTQAKGQISHSVWPAVGPGAAITWTIVGFYLLGNAFRDALAQDM